FDNAVVHRAERRCGGGDEQRYVVVQRGDAPPAALQPGFDELVGVAAVDLGAGRAHRRTAVTARGVDDPVWHVGRGVGGDAVPGLVGDVNVAVEADRVPAAGRGPDVVQPFVVLGCGGAVHDGR